jgi:hypothetical protein
MKPFALPLIVITLLLAVSFVNPLRSLLDTIVTFTLAKTAGGTPSPPAFRIRGAEK